MPGKEVGSGEKAILFVVIVPAPSMSCYGESRVNWTIIPAMLGSQRGMPFAILLVVPAGPSNSFFPR